MKKIEAVVKGLVQGVGFRYFVYRAAQRIGVKGIVKNMDNGDVYVFAEGTEKELNNLIDELWKGPRLSKVDDIELKWDEGEPEHSFFEIDY